MVIRGEITHNASSKTISHPIYHLGPTIKHSPRPHQPPSKDLSSHIIVSFRRFIILIQSLQQPLIHLSQPQLRIPQWRNQWYFHHITVLITHLNPKKKWSFKTYNLLFPLLCTPQTPYNMHPIIKELKLWKNQKYFNPTIMLLWQKYLNLWRKLQEIQVQSYLLSQLPFNSKNHQLPPSLPWIKWQINPININYFSQLS